MFSNYKKSIDERGILYAINSIKEFPVKRFYLIEPKIGFWRGKHYHKTSTQFISILEGQVECKIINEKTGQINNINLLEGDMFLQNPEITFAFKAISENTKMLVFCDSEFNQNDYFESKIKNF